MSMNFMGLDFDKLAEGLSDSIGQALGGSQRESINPRDLAGKNTPLAGVFDGGGSNGFGDLLSTLSNSEAIPDVFGAGGAFARADAFHFGEEQKAKATQQAREAQQRGTLTPTGGTASGATPTNLTPDVAQWDKQTQATFGDLGGWLPNAMLAIIQHESEGKPTAYNGAAPGGAWGLFQQLGINTNDPNAQFTAAKQLAQQKLSSIQASYAAHGLNPDERTRARDFFLAWAGHFDYDTGQPNPTSTDIGNGEDYSGFLNGPRGIMPMYDNIVTGRQAVAQQPTSAAGATATGPQAPTGSRGFASITGGLGVPEMQGFGSTPYAQANPGVYAFGAEFGIGPGQHTGIDVGVPRGTKTYTPVGGTVIIAGNSGFYKDNAGGAGEIRIQLDDGSELILGHMSTANIQVGQRVNAGDFVGLSGGSDGDHIHVERRIRDKSTPSGWRIVNPYQFL